MQAAKVPAELLLLLRANVLEVLVPEDHHAALGDEQGELVLLRVGQLRELEARDLGSHARRQLGGLHAGVALAQKIGLCGIGIQTTVSEAEQLGTGELGGRVVDGEVCPIFGLHVHRDYERKE